MNSYIDKFKFIKTNNKLLVKRLNNYGVINFEPVWLTDENFKIYNKFKVQFPNLFNLQEGVFEQINDNMFFILLTVGHNQSSQHICPVYKNKDSILHPLFLDGFVIKESPVNILSNTKCINKVPYEINDHICSPFIKTCFMNTDNHGNRQHKSSEQLGYHFDLLYDPSDINSSAKFCTA